MKLIKLSFLLILMGLGLLLSGASEQGGAAEYPSQQIRTDKHEKTSEKKKTETINQTQRIAPAEFEKSLIESLRTIANQQKAANEQSYADKKPWWIDPALLVVAFVYTVFAGLQWWAIRRQAKIARRTLRAIRRQAEVAADTLRAIDRQANIADKTLDAINRQATAAEQTLAALEKQVEAAIEQGKISRISAEAAQKSAEAAIQNAKTAQLTLNIERPYIFAEEQKLRAKNADRLTSIVGPIEPDPLTMNIEISFKLINRGKGVAVIDGVRIHGRITPGLFDAVISKRTFGRNVSNKSIQLHIRQQIIGPENASPYLGGFSLLVEDWQRILSRQNQIFILGIIRYKDVFGRPFYKSFRFAYEPPSQALIGPAPELPGFLYVADKKRKRDKQTIKERFEIEIG